MANYSRQQIVVICTEALNERNPADPALFDRIVEQLEGAGIAVNQEETQKVRSQGPNVVAVYETFEGPDYIELSAGTFEVSSYHGEPTAELIAAGEVERWCPNLDPDDLRNLRFVARNGEKHFDSADIYRIADRKDAERAARRVLSLVLPDEFLQLCENVTQCPAKIIQGFIADLCHLQAGDYLTNGSDERELAQEYFRRCGYRRMTQADSDEHDA